MSAIANFKKRRDAAKADSHELKAEQKPENEALALLAVLLGCDEQDAIEQATELVEQKARFVEMKIGVDLASGDDSTVTAEVTLDHEGHISDIKTDLEDSTSSINQAADSVETAASDVSEASSDLAYNADEIASVTAEIKAATSELKKPSAGQRSSPGAKNEQAKSSSKK